MLVPELRAHMPATTPCAVALVGIEAHICITQTALALAREGHRVYVLADGVSSCNKEEVGVALDRLRGEENVTVTSSEGWVYEVMGDAGIEEFKAVARIVKETGEDTKVALAGLLSKM
jgi:isochorismatase family protein